MQGRFLVRALVAVGFVAAMAALVSLGMWQLERGREKAEIRAVLAARGAEPAVQIGAGPLDPGEYEYRRAVATGTWRIEDQVLIDNQVRNGRPGYRVITPLALAGGDMHVLVDRGWVPWGASRDELPATPAPAGEVTVEGMLKQPAADFYTLEKEKPGADSAVWQNLDIAHYRDLKAYPLQDLVLLMSPDSTGGGFARELLAYDDDWVARHRAYALQWFGLAAVLLIIVAVLTVRANLGRRRRGQH